MKIEEPVCLHGQVFDNHKRWCANCNKTVAPYNWTCNDCGAIWPENVAEFLEEIQSNRSVLEIMH